MLKISGNILRVKYWERSNLSLCETIFAIHRDYFKIYCGKVGTLFGSVATGTGEAGAVLRVQTREVYLKSTLVM